METMVRSSNGFLSALSADDYELIRPHLRTGDLPHDAVLVATGETLKRAYFPHRGVISLVVELARGEHVQVAMIGRDSLLGTLSIMGDACALNTAIVLVPGSASMMDLDRLRVAADQSCTLRTLLTRVTDWRSTRRCSRPRAATPLIRWSHGCRAACSTPMTSPATTGCC
ncbi:CRP-like cAMP-binding protein [Bradyrhizobium sp. GM5.1]